jgi:hypothetical protein
MCLPFSLKSRFFSFYGRSNFSPSLRCVAFCFDLCHIFLSCQPLGAFRRFVPGALLAWYRALENFFLKVR